MGGSGDGPTSGPTSGPTNGDPGQREPPSPKAAPRYSATFDPWTMSEIRRAAATGIYDIRGAGAKRPLPHFDDLLFLGASISRYPLEGYRERCGTDVTLGSRFASKPLRLKIPITIAGMSFGSLSGQAKEALGRGANAAGTSTTSGSRPYYDVALAVKSGADVVVVDGMQGGTAATQNVFIEHVGQPTLACIRPAVQALQELDMHRKVQLVVSGGIRSGADVAKALALGADAVSIGSAALIAMGDNDPKHEAEYRALGSTAGAYDAWHEGRDPAGITTQDPELASRLDPVVAGRRLANYLGVATLEAQTIARACGKSHVHHLEPEDLVALSVEAAAMARVPLAGTGWMPGTSQGTPMG